MSVRSVQSDDFFHGESAGGTAPLPLVAGDSLPVSDEPAHPGIATSNDTDTNKSWTINLRDVSSRLNVSVDHLVEGLRASVPDKSPMRIAAEAEEAAPTASEAVPFHTLHEVHGSRAPTDGANTTLSASGSFPYSPEITQSQVPVPNGSASPAACAASRASSVLSVSPSKHGNGLVLQLQVDSKSNRLMRGSGSPRSSLSRTPTLSPQKNPSMTRADRERAFDDHLRETPPRAGQVFAPQGGAPQPPKSRQVAVPSATRQQEAAGSPRLAVSLSLPSGGLLSGTQLSVERILKSDSMIHGPHPPSVVMGQQQPLPPQPAALSSNLSRTSPIPAPQSASNHQVVASVSDLSELGSDGGLYDEAAGYAAKPSRGEREPLLHRDLSGVGLQADVVSRQGSLGSESMGMRRPSDAFLQPPEKDKKKKNVGFLNVGGSPISQVHIYEAIDQEAIVLDVEYQRPRWVWMGLLFINACLAYSATMVQTVEEASSLPNDQAAAVLAFWTSMGQAVLLVIVLPFLFFPTKSDKEFMTSWHGVVLLTALSLVMTAERILAQIALDYTKNDEDGGKVPSYIAITQFPLMLLVGQACAGKQTILVEVFAAVVGCAGMGLMMSNSLHNYEVKHASRLVGGLGLGFMASIFGALEIVLVHKLRNSMPLVFLLSASQLLSGLLCFPIAIFWGIGPSDIFSEVTTYKSWQYFSIVGVLTIGNALTYHVLSFLHPVTIALAVNAQAVFVLSFVEDDNALLGAGYLIGATFLLTASGWGSYLSARIRRNISIEVALR
eukprot:TRINITY_DN19606_c0_g1_i1.p1 TRINITY_DN19606_c0_g1~~TRINITY_DN19606_c0_g1_i1.p1  ORF type:complete len:779 (+),score=214.14 TRINITY_DN19606_c0_g1_i1:102-2438(+)